MDEIKIRFANIKDLNFCKSQDYKHVKRSVLKRRIEEGSVIVAEFGKKKVGYLRIEYLWLSVPYISIVSVAEDYRGKGTGKRMIGFLEKYLTKNGHKFLYSSSQSNESQPKKWHRKVGFKTCGHIKSMNKGNIDEIFFRKNIVKTEK